MGNQHLHVLHLASFHDTNQLYLRLMEALARLDTAQTAVSPRGFNKEQSSDALISYHGKSLLNALDKIWFSRKVSKYTSLLSTIPDRHRFNVSHAHSLYSDGVAAHRLWKTQGIPYIVTIRHTDLAIFSRFFIHLRGQARDVIKNASHVIFVNKNYPAKLAELLNLTLDPTKYSVIRNGMNEYWFQEQAAFTPDEKGCIRILSVAEVLPRKNHATLIKAVRKHNKDRQTGEPDMHLTVIGRCDGAYGKRLKARYQSDDINFTGKLPFDQIASHMGRSDVFALLSKPENFGVAYAEAVAQGLPVIYTREQGFDGWVDDGYWGHACSSHNVDEFLQKVLSIGANNRLSPEAQAKARELFDWNTIASDIRQLYDAAVHNTPTNTSTNVR